MRAAIAILVLLAGASWSSAQGPAPAAPGTPPTPAPSAPQPPAPEPAQRPDQAPQPTQPRQPLAEKYAQRLAALDPSRPEEYYRLGEEIADEVELVEDRRLATSLYVLAATLDIKRGGRPVTASAACVALADLIRNERERRWLVYLSRTLDPRRVPPEWLARAAPTTADSPVYQMAAALGLVRSGHGIQARQLLEKPEVKAGLARLESMLQRMGGGSLFQVTREAQRWPCPECSGGRITKRGNPPDAKICPICKADPGPVISENVFLGQLRFEAVLLQGNQRSWAAQLAADEGAPLRDTDPSTLPVVFEVDPDKPFWRDGQWVPDPSAPRPPPKPAKPADPPASGAPAETADPVPPSSSGS
ncbi:MAG TPA: hypothetical protein VD997_14190 [Phycisphaerales bacterium]|nr:hypothetical protein [Phycisphaerales bacterium]